MKAPTRSRKTLLVAIVGVLLAALLPSLAAQAETVPAERTQAPGQSLGQQAVPAPQANLTEAKKDKKKKKKVTKKAKKKADKKAKKKVVKKKPTPAPTASPKPTPKAPKVGASDTPPTDYSSLTPQTMRDNIVGDFRGAGYQQRMRVEGTQLVTRDPAQQGGLVTSVPSDLAPAPASVGYNVLGYQGKIETHQLTTYSDWYNGAYGFLFNKFHVNSVYLAEMDGWVYILGTQGSNGYNPAVDPRVPSDQYRVRLYKVGLYTALNGCATESCATVTMDFPTTFNLDGGAGGARIIGPSSLAAGKVGDNGYLAVGMTDGGVLIVNPDNLQTVYHFTGMATDGGDQTPPMGLSWDPSGSGLLAVAVMSPGYVGFFVWFGSDGQPTTWHIWPLAPGSSLIPTPISVTLVNQPDDPNYPIVGVFGLNDGTVAILDPAPPGSGRDLLVVGGTSGQQPGFAVAITPIPRVDAPDAGGPDLAVSYQTDIAGAPVTQTIGGVLRWPPGSAVGSLSLLKLNPAGDTTLSANDFDAWYPGLKQGRVSITNSSQEEIQVSLQSSPDSGSGCWWAPDWADAATFPSAGLTIAPGATTDRYVIGYQSSGPDGSCFTTDAPGVKRAYAVITPTNRPADQAIVAIRLETSQLKVSLPSADQAGSGSTTATIAKVAQYGAIGYWSLTVDTSDLPTPAAAPEVALVQLSPGASGLDNPSATSAVYRLNIKPVTWNVPGLKSTTIARRQAVLPPLDVQGSNDGDTWTTIGSFLPTGTVNYDITQGTATISGGSIYWENTATTSYTSLRVRAGTGAAAQASDPVALTAQTLTPGFAADSMTIAAGNSTALVAPNGIDSFPIAVKMPLDTETPPSVDPLQSVYYRKSNYELITNISIPGRENEFVGIQPAAGAYPNSTSVGKPAITNKDVVVTGTDYLTTTNKNETDITAVVSPGSATTIYVTSNVLKVTPTLMSLQVGTTTAAGFTVDSCSTGTNGGCGAADIAPAGTSTDGSGARFRAAIYQAGTVATESSDAGAPQLGILFKGIAINDKNSLPLAWKTGSMPTVATSELTINYSSDMIAVATLSNFPAKTGILVPVVSRGLFLMDTVSS